jgi:REP element-mobilizing transposase RayT
MVGLLTFTTYGTWLRGGRGWIDGNRRGSVRAVPEPRRRDPAARDKSAKWSAVKLDDEQKQVVADDLARIAELRSFTIHTVVVAEDHVHLLYQTGAGHGDEPHEQLQLVQLIKGALSRALTVATGDAQPESLQGEALPHHKWWTRQFSLLDVPDGKSYDLVRDRLERHPDALVRVAEEAGFPG